MRLLKLHLTAFGLFTDRVLDFGSDARRLVLVHGPNEAGKSCALRAISDLRFGIPAQSKDNFVHAHPEMRVGGEFVDRNGKKYSLMRRKGRGATLLFAEFDRTTLAIEQPAPPEVEALLTCGLNKDAYDSMFGLDHRRLREGGQALLKGEGDVGAALFEASAGVRSIPQVLDRLDASARRFFVPGPRGKNARINEALASYEEHHIEFKRAQIRPAQWSDLFKKHRAAADELAEIDNRRVEINGELLLIRELRAVAPLLSTLDSASRVLDDLKSVTLLATNAVSERAAAESGLSDAQHNAGIAALEFAREQMNLSELELDTAVLSVGTAVKRLAASTEAIDQHERDIADATVELESETDEVDALATRIEPLSSSDEVIGRAPTKAQWARIEEILRSVELAQQALDQDVKSGLESAVDEAPAEDELPSAEARTALRIAQAEITRSDVDLKQLTRLSGEIKAARRMLGASLAEIGLPDETALQLPHPLLDAHIDMALKEDSGNAIRREGLLARISEISDALPPAIGQRDRLLEQGVVATWDDVAADRSRRQSGWALVRGKYIDGTNPLIDDHWDGEQLPEAYEHAVIQADRTIDELAGDTERAAKLQGSRRAIEVLEGDRDELNRQLDEINGEERNRNALWTATLAAANLSALSPSALREWQGQLLAARAQYENLQAKVDELDRVQGVERTLAVRLRAAIEATGLATVAVDVPLGTLSATAAEITEIVKQREAAIQTAAGTRTERERQRQQRAAQGVTLAAALQSAKDALKPILMSLWLSENSSVAVVRARLDEFEELADAKSRLVAAQTKVRRARASLSVVRTAAKEIWGSLGDAEPADLRLYGDQISARLHDAESMQTARKLAQRAADKALESQQDHEKTAERHRNSIANLCLAAGVESANHLPEAEERSRRKRKAQDGVDQSLSQLALASRRSVDDLRAFLADRDSARMDTDEASYTHEQTQIDSKLRLAREREEVTRRDLEAIDGSDTAAVAREAMERAASGVRSNMPPWIRSKIAHALLGEALKRFRERAQGPMLKAASGYFEHMTRGEFARLFSDDSGREPVLIAQRSSGARIRVEEMSEGTLDQLYLALRLAALDIRRGAGIDLPVILDDVLMTSDEDRSGATLDALAEFARGNQVIVFTHHRHIADVAARHVASESLSLVPL